MSISAVTYWQLHRGDNTVTTVEHGDYVEVYLVNCDLKTKGYVHNIHPNKIWIKETPKEDSRIHEIKKSGITDIKVLRQRRKYVWTLK